MKGMHSWKAARQFTGEYNDLVAGRKYMTCLHEVECSECRKVVILPADVMPEEVVGCLGTSARPVIKRDPPAEEFKDDDTVQAPKKGGGGKVHHLHHR